MLTSLIKTYENKEGELCVHASFVSVDVGEETPRTVCSGLVGSVPLEELQVWPFNSNERMELKKQNKQNKSNKTKQTKTKKLVVVHLTCTCTRHFCANCPYEMLLIQWCAILNY